MEILGLDIGGSGVKGAIVNTITGELVSERLRLPTPQPSTPANIAITVKEMVNEFAYKGPVGCSFPTVVINGTAMTSGNIHESWKGTPVDQLFSNATGNPFVVFNDADLAGMAEMKHGAGVGLDGMVIMVTIGTGLGTGIFYNGQLVPNIELGRTLGKKGEPIEFYASDRARKENDLSWAKWGKRFDFFLKTVVRVFSPNHFIIGGGASKKFELYQHKISVPTPIKIAKYKNNAGIVGAAIAARKENQ